MIENREINKLAVLLYIYIYLFFSYICNLGWIIKTKGLFWLNLFI